MKNLSLSPDDQPPIELSASDRALRRQLDASLTQRFEHQCDPFLTQLLSRCDWYITTYTNVVTLVIACPDSSTNWEVLHHVAYFGTPMEQFSQDAKIRIYPPMGTGEPFEIRVDELSIYRESP
ncbi:MAG: hypothetical protein NW220_06940 [Leptolyngbyaceae cyanobacterium bins.349]|nr:hypothetical protein [Leptolyngbyaceae cyanobacterium bins.349]